MLLKASLSGRVCHRTNRHFRVLICRNLSWLLQDVLHRHALYLIIRMVCYDDGLGAGRSLLALKTTDASNEEYSLWVYQCNSLVRLVPFLLWNFGLKSQNPGTVFEGWRNTIHSRWSIWPRDSWVEPRSAGWPDLVQVCELFLLGPVAALVSGFKGLRQTKQPRKSVSSRG